MDSSDLLMMAWDEIMSMRVERKERIVKGWMGKKMEGTIGKQRRGVE
jgi:hypothetical protein